MHIELRKAWVNLKSRPKSEVTIKVVPGPVVKINEENRTQEHQAYVQLKFMKKAPSPLLVYSIVIHGPIYDWGIDCCSYYYCPADMHVPTGSESTYHCLRKSDKYQLPSPITNRSSADPICNI